MHRAEVTEAMRSAEADIVSAKRAEEEEKRRQAEAQGEEVQEEDKKGHEAGFLPRETFLQCLAGVGAPFTEDQLVKLAALHDKTKSGNINYAEFLSEQKYITAVSQWCQSLVRTNGRFIEITLVELMLCTYVCKYVWQQSLLHTVHTYVCTFVQYTYIRMFIRMYVDVHVRTYVCTYVCVYVRICACQR